MRRQPTSVFRGSASNRAIRNVLGLTDRCWALPFLVACVTLLFTLPCTSGGLFYVLFMDKFNVNREAATWTKTIAWATSYIMGFVIGALQDKVSTYNTILVGAVMCAIALVASAYVPNMAWMCVTFGFLYGASFGILGISTSVYVVSYFDKYRSFALALRFCPS
ncbi:monocarboxylate transporter 14-like [Amblyomma americanum]